MKFLRKLVAAGLIVFVFIASMAVYGHASQPAFAQDDATPTPPPTRRTTISVNYTAFEWWMIRWDDNTIACRAIIDHEGRPTNFELGQACNQDIYDEWLLTTSCPQAEHGGNVHNCQGYYLQLASSGPSQKKVNVDLPLPNVLLSVEGCTLDPPNNRCKNLPTLILTGEEPLPNEAIIRLQGAINGQPFSCPGRQCAIPLQPTGIQGISIEFWADSSFGDSSKHFTAQVRAIPWGDFMAPEGGTQDQKMYYVDVISSQFRDGNLTSCTDIWGTFPDIGGPPPWLTSPKTVQGLESNQGFYYLAGMLIQNGAVDASSCPGGGLDQPGVANTCGVNAAGPQLMEWQNQFNTEILDVSQQTGIPAQLMKNIFSRESQFWPGLYKDYQEAGLGQLTENGADTVLLWNPDFFSQFCPLVLDKTVCSWGFGNLDEYSQTLLRGALVRKVNSTCENCPLGIDLSQAKFSIRVFAESLLGNCLQISQIIFNNTEKKPGEVSSFVDLWKYTLANYNAGPGCIGDAIQRAWDENQKINWDLVTQKMDPVCQLSVKYIEDVTNYPPPKPSPTPRIQVGKRPLTTPFVPTLEPSMEFHATEGLPNSARPTFTPTP